MRPPDGLCVHPADPSAEAAADALSARLGVPLVRDAAAAGAAPLCLRCGADGLSLLGGGMTLRADLTQMRPRLRRSNLAGELLVRAAKPKSLGPSPTALDATAGLGEDALLLAASGFAVTLCERDPVIAALLADSLARAAREADLAPLVARMTLIEGDSIEVMRALDAPPDVILLDPMYPERQKSGRIKKKLQLLQRLEEPCGEEAALLAAARALHPKKILIKRPAKGPHLAGASPSYVLVGTAIRYDCYV